MAGFDWFLNYTEASYHIHVIMSNLVNHYSIIPSGHELCTTGTIKQWARYGLEWNNAAKLIKIIVVRICFEKREMILIKESLDQTAIVE